MPRAHSVCGTYGRASSCRLILLIILIVAILVSRLAGLIARGQSNALSEIGFGSDHPADTCFGRLLIKKAAWRKNTQSRVIKTPNRGPVGDDTQRQENLQEMVRASDAKLERARP